MKPNFYTRTHKILRYLAIAVALWYGGWMVTALFFGFPIPRGTKIDPDYNSYYKNIRGVYYISVDHPLTLITHGHFGYLHDVDLNTFTVLSDSWAKDASHVWHGDKVLEMADIATFHVDSSGLPKDKSHIYVHDDDYSNAMRPSSADIDPETAEYFVKGFFNLNYIRDKYNVYLDEKRLDVDRNSFTQIGRSHWYVDKDFVYTLVYDHPQQRWTLTTTDSLRTPIDTINSGCRYLRNGCNIIYNDSVILKGIDVKRFEEIGLDKCIVNDLLLLNGQQMLKDSLDVSIAKFYFYGHIAADNRKVYYNRKRLHDIDAPTFRRINDETFEDKNYIYTLKDRAWAQDDPFERKKKHP